MSPSLALLLVHAIATTLMTGLIWFVQIVHYPLMKNVGAEVFISYERRHQARTTRVVAPLMLAEMVTAAVIAARAASLGVSGAWAGVALSLLIVIWFSTALLQVPLHRRLEDGFEARAWRQLVRTNWIRTAAWSARAPLALSFLHHGAA